MSGWGLGWFGGGAQKQKDAPKKAILQLRAQLEMLNKREAHLQNQANEQDALARKYVSTNKTGKRLLPPPRLQTPRQGLTPDSRQDRAAPEEAV